MVSPFVLRSSHAGDRVTLAEPGDVQYVVTIEAAGLRAQAAVYHHCGDGIEGFFHELATAWRGWAGEKHWESLESTLGLRATADRAGHIALAVSLSDGTPARWTARAELAVEAGQLATLAGGAKVFARHLGRAV